MEIQTIHNLKLIGLYDLQEKYITEEEEEAWSHILLDLLQLGKSYAV